MSREFLLVVGVITLSYLTIGWFYIAFSIVTISGTKNFMRAAALLWMFSWLWPILLKDDIREKLKSRRTR
jgi:hypothetical protein